MPIISREKLYACYICEEQMNHAQVEDVEDIWESIEEETPDTWKKMVESLPDYNEPPFCHDEYGIVLCEKCISVKLLEAQQI